MNIQVLGFFSGFFCAINGKKKGDIFHGLGVIRLMVFFLLFKNLSME
jgi:hypothetical protein